MHSATKNVAIKTITVIASRSASGSALNIKAEVYQKAVRLKKFISGCCKVFMSNAASQRGSAFLKTMLRTNPKGALFYGQLSGAQKMLGGRAAFHQRVEDNAFHRTTVT